MKRQYATHCLIKNLKKFKKGNKAIEKGKLKCFIFSSQLLNTEENKSSGRVRLIAILKSLQPLETLYSYILP